MAGSFDSIIDSLERRITQNPDVDRQAFPSRAKRRIYRLIEFDSDSQGYLALIEDRNHKSNHRLTPPVLKIYEIKLDAIISSDPFFWTDEDLVGKMVHSIDANDDDYLEVYKNIFKRVEGLKTTLDDLGELRNYEGWFRKKEAGQKVKTFW